MSSEKDQKLRESTAVAALSGLLPQTGEELASACAASSSGTTLNVGVGQQLIATPNVTAVVGVTKNADRPVVLRLALPSLGMLSLVDSSANHQNSSDKRGRFDQLLPEDLLSALSECDIDAIQDALDSTCTACNQLEIECTCIGMGLHGQSNLAMDHWRSTTPTEPITREHMLAPLRISEIARL